MPRTLKQAAIFVMPAVFVLLWSSGFIGAKFGLKYTEPLTYLLLRMLGVLILLGIIIALTRPKWPNAAGFRHSVVTGLLVHGLYLGGVFVAIGHGLPAGLAALLVSLQPLLTSTLANRWLGERVGLRQWIGLAIGLVGVYLVLRDKATTGEATPLAWASVTVGLARHHGRYDLSEALRRRDRLAAGIVDPICGGGGFVCCRRVRVRDPHRALDA